MNAPRSKTKRKYRLAPAGRASLRQHKPWQKSTGPRTPTGKLIVSQNNFKHGLSTRDAGQQKAEFAAHLRRMRTGMAERAKPVQTAEPGV